MRRLLLCLVFAVILALSLAKPVSSISRGRGSSQEQVIHVVQAGENLYRISLRYDTTVDAIVNANGLTNAIKAMIASTKPKVRATWRRKCRLWARAWNSP